MGRPRQSLFQPDSLLAAYAKAHDDSRGVRRPEQGSTFHPGRDGEPENIEHSASNIKVLHVD
jgi:hypothetical protein